MNYHLEYNDILVKNLILVSEINIEINIYIDRINKNDPKFQEIENSTKSEILYYFAKLVNLNVKLKDVRKFALGQNSFPDTPKEKIILNIRNVLDYVNASYQGEKFNLVLLNHLNKLFLDGIKDIWDIGKSVSSVNDVDESFDFFKKQNYITQSGLGNFIRDIEDSYYSSNLANILKDLLVIYSLLSNCIYSSGNDAVALGILMFLFKKNNYNKFANFYRVINRVNEASSNDLNFNQWLELVINELQKELKDIKIKLVPFLDDIKIVEDKYIDLNLRQIRGLNYIKEKGKISRELYSKLNNVSQITSYRDLTSLLQKGYVRVEGIGKATRYVI